MKDLKLKEVPEEMRKRICQMMNSTWQAIGSDCLTAREECGEKGAMPRSEVIEVVCDADYASMYGDDKEAYEIFKRLSYDDMKKLGKIAFPYTRYGW